MTEQVFYQQQGRHARADVHHARRDMKHDGSNPTLLYGYGGFDISLTPAFSRQVLAWLEMGGVYAVANLRGGGEYGEAWHQAGTLAQQAERVRRLHRRGGVSDREQLHAPQRALAIHGRSNGGLLVGAVLTQRPDLFGAALPAVGVLDMLRYHTRAPTPRQWSTDYGTVRGPGGVQGAVRLLAVSQRAAGRVLSADARHHRRPRRPRGALAQLQVRRGAAGGAGLRQPILMRVETRAGHGSGKPVWMQIEDFADQWAFLAKGLGVNAPASP